MDSTRGCTNPVAIATNDLGEAEICNYLFDTYKDSASTSDTPPVGPKAGEIYLYQLGSNRSKREGIIKRLR